MLACAIGQVNADLYSEGSYDLLGGFWPSGPLRIVEFDGFVRFAEQWFR